MMRWLQSWNFNNDVITWLVLRWWRHPGAGVRDDVTTELEFQWWRHTGQIFQWRQAVVKAMVCISPWQRLRWWNVSSLILFEAMPRGSSKFSAVNTRMYGLFSTRRPPGTTSYRTREGSVQLKQIYFRSFTYVFCIFKELLTYMQISSFHLVQHELLINVKRKKTSALLIHCDAFKLAKIQHHTYTQRHDSAAVSIIT